MILEEDTKEDEEDIVINQGWPNQGSQATCNSLNNHQLKFGKNLVYVCVISVYFVIITTNEK